jgi:hypothetical protein
MNATHLEKIFYHYIDTRPEIENLINARFFETPEIREAHEIRKDFRKKYHKPPTASQLKEISKVKGIDDKLSPERIDILYEVNLSQYDPDWVQETTESWIEFKNLDVSVLDLVQYLKTTKVSTENIKDVVQTAKSIITDRNNIDFKFDEGLDFFDPGSHRQLTNETFTTGFPYLDTVLGGGYSPKTLIALAGMPKVGKCHHYSTKIKIRNKRTGEIQEIEVGKFHEETKKEFLGNPACYIVKTGSDDKV